MIGYGVNLERTTIIGDTNVSDMQNKSEPLNVQDHHRECSSTNRYLPVNKQKKDFCLYEWLK